MKSDRRPFFNVQGVYTYTSSYKEQITGNRKGFASPTMDQMDFGASADQKTGGWRMNLRVWDM